jgi:thioredoxin-dependent peroxiredoxin
VIWYESFDPSKATKGRRMIKKKSKKKLAKSGAKRVKAAAKTGAPAKRSKAAPKRKSAPRAPAAAAPRPKAAAAAKPTGGSKAAAGSLAEGARAPDFRLPRDGGSAVSLADFAGEKLVIYFYPRADTPGCTREAMDFSRLAKQFAAAHTQVIGVSADPVKAQDAFRDKYKLDVPLVSDEAKSMIKAYGAWGEKSMYGRTFEGIIRTTVLVGADGRVQRIWRHVKVDGHADAVLTAAREG